MVFHFIFMVFRYSEELYAGYGSALKLVSMKRIGWDAQLSLNICSAKKLG